MKIRKIVRTISTLTLVGLIALNVSYVTDAFWQEILSLNAHSVNGVDGGIPINTAPIMNKNLTEETYSNISIEIPLKSYDSDGDKVIYKIIETPSMGMATIDLNKIIYSPAPKQIGIDKLSCVAIDTFGNSSEPMEIKVVIKKNPTNLTYSDMIDESEHYAAIKLSELGAITGQRIGGNYFLKPETPVNRNEFITMIVSASKLKPSNIADVSFGDDETIDAWAREAVNTAIDNKLVTGYGNDESYKTWRGNDYITRAEATVILDRLIDFNAASNVISNINSDNIPVWASQAVINLDNANIINSSSEFRPNEVLTIREACSLIYNTVKHMKQK